MWSLLAITWPGIIIPVSTGPWNSEVPQKALFQTIYRLKSHSNGYTVNLSSNNHRLSYSRYGPISIYVILVFSVLLSHNTRSHHSEVWNEDQEKPKYN